MIIRLKHFVMGLTLKNDCDFFSSFSLSFVLAYGSEQNKEILPKGEKDNKYAINHKYPGYRECCGWAVVITGVAVLTRRAEYASLREDWTDDPGRLRHQRDVQGQS